MDSTTNDEVVFVLYAGQPKDEIPRSVTHVAVDPSIRRIEDHAFENCSDLVRVTTLASGLLQAIGNSAFRKCTLLQSIQVPYSLETIGDCAFEFCDCLASMIFPEPPQGERGGLRSIGRRAFRWCQSLECVSMPKTIEFIGNDAFHWCPFLLDVNLNNGLKKIGDGAFAHCTQIRALDLPPTLATVGMCAFHSCDSLMEVGLAHTHLEVMPYATFSKCYSLYSITLPSTLKIIGKCAFFECQSLVDVEFQEGLKSIATKAFSECKGLCGIALPASLQRVGGEAFEFCTSLLCVEFASGSHVKLGPHSFRGCEALVTLSIPRSMDSISNDTFVGCNLLWINGSIEALFERYEHLPVHEMCYHSSRAEDDNLVFSLVSLHLSGDDGDLKDSFGMTPHHIVATSVRASAVMLEYFLDRYPSKIVEHKDKHGRTMMDYLLMRTSSSAIRLIQIVLQRFVVNRIAGWKLGSERDSELSRRVEALRRGHNIRTRREIVKKIFEYAGFCATIELASLIELAVWRMRMDTVKREVTHSKLDRPSCRYQCGADVVVENVMEFLWDVRSKLEVGLSIFPLYHSFADE